jgi:hypothetical protein
MDRAMRIVEVLGRLISGIIAMVRSGDPRRVADIVPDKLLSELEYAAGEARARAKFPERDDA